MKTNTTPRKSSFLRFALFSAALAVLAFTNASAQVTVEILHYFSVEGQLKSLDEMKKEFEVANPDIKINYTYVPFGELVSRTLQMAAVRRPPAISAIDNPDVLRVAKAGILKDISADVAKLKTWEDTYPGPKAAVSDGDKVFGVPVGSNSLALYYNKTMLIDAGVTSAPETWAKLTETAEKTTKDKVYGIAFSAVNTEEATWQWEPFLWSNGGSLTDLGSTRAMEALQLWVDWVKKGVASKDVVNWGQGDVPNQFIGKRAAMMEMGPWQLDNVKNSGIDFGIVTIPVPEAGKKPVVPLGGEVWCVLKGDSKVEEAAIKFIAFTQEPERLRKICDTFNYISSVKSVAKEQGEANADLLPFVEQMETARARSQDGGAKYPEISLATRNAIQRALTGQASAEEALKDAAAKIKEILAD